jgi:hypothetical protein
MPRFSNSSIYLQSIIPQTMFAVEPMDEALGLAIAAFFFTEPEYHLFQPFFNQ